MFPGLGQSPGGGHGNVLQYSCLENTMDRGAWRATVQGVEKSQTQLSDLADMHPSPSHRPSLRRKFLWDTVPYAQNLSWLKMNWEPHGLIHDAHPHVGQSPKSQPCCVCPLCLVLLFSPTQTPRSILPLPSDSCLGLLPEDSSSGSPSQLSTGTSLSCGCTLP